jgi:hypothetical protein
MSRTLISILSLALAAAAAAPLSAQYESPWPGTRPERPRAVELFAARSRVDVRGGRTELHAMGARVMWGLSAAGSLRAPRTWLGGYLLHAPDDAPGVSMTHYGIEGDLHLLRGGPAGRVSPFVSLGLGAVRVREAVAPVFPVPGILTDLVADDGSVAALRVRAPRPATVSTTSVSVVPGAGAQVHLLPGLRLRGEVRGVVDFRERTTRTVEVTGGISLAV